MSEPHKWFCIEHQTVEPTRYACVNKVLDAKTERIRTLEAENSALIAVSPYYERAIAAEAEVARLRENEYAVLHKGRDLMAWVKVAEAAQARVRELEEKLNNCDEKGPGFGTRTGTN